MFIIHGLSYLDKNDPKKFDLCDPLESHYFDDNTREAASKITLSTNVSMTLVQRLLTSCQITFSKNETLRPSLLCLYEKQDGSRALETYDLTLPVTDESLKQDLLDATDKKQGLLTRAAVIIQAHLASQQAPGVMTLVRYCLSGMTYHAYTTKCGVFYKTYDDVFDNETPRRTNMLVASEPYRHLNVDTTALDVEHMLSTRAYEIAARRTETQHIIYKKPYFNWRRLTYVREGRIPHRFGFEIFIDYSVQPNKYAIVFKRGMTDDRTHLLGTLSALDETHRMSDFLDTALVTAGRLHVYRCQTVDVLAIPCVQLASTRLTRASDYAQTIYEVAQVEKARLVKTSVAYEQAHVMTDTQVAKYLRSNAALAAETAIQAEIEIQRQKRKPAVSRSHFITFDEFDRQTATEQLSIAETVRFYEAIVKAYETKRPTEPVLQAFEQKLPKTTKLFRRLMTGDIQAALLHMQEVCEFFNETTKTK